MKTSELLGPALDWAVAKCERFEDGRIFLWGNKEQRQHIRVMNCPDAPPREYQFSFEYSPSTDWAQGGPIIEREGIPTRKHSGGTWYAHMNLGDGERAPWHKYEWVTSKTQKQVRFDGPTPLIAAMRAYVASKLGDEVEIPEELQ